VGRVSRDAYAEAFRRVTGRPLVKLPQMAGANDSEIFFESLALNTQGDTRPEGNVLLTHYVRALAVAFGARQGLLTEQGRVLPGAREALAAVSRQDGVIQTVLTGSIRENASAKLRAFGLDGFLDLDIGGFGSDVYPKGAAIVRALVATGQKYGITLSPAYCAYLADSVRDVAAAEVGGVRCVGIGSGRSTLGELRDAGADPVLTDLTDTARVVAAIMRA
jgi:phosphoglycolate phosphatase